MSVLSSQPTAVGSYATVESAEAAALMDAPLLNGLKAIESQTPSGPGKRTSIRLGMPLDHTPNKMASN